MRIVSWKYLQVEMGAGNFTWQKSRSTDQRGVFSPGRDWPMNDKTDEETACRGCRRAYVDPNTRRRGGNASWALNTLSSSGKKVTSIWRKSVSTGGADVAGRRARKIGVHFLRGIAMLRVLSP
jgi:hypothetical protein